jgi:hypothetical protein
MSRLSGLRVVRSSVEGYGVVATRTFRRGSVVADVEGVLWREGERRDDRHSLVLEEGIFFDMVDQTRWVNHSCAPNIVVEAGVTARGNGWAQLQALRTLRAGDELFYDYAFPLELAEPCRCGARSCRGFIVDPALVGQLPGAVKRADAPSPARRGAVPSHRLRMRHP